MSNDTAEMAETLREKDPEVAEALDVIFAARPDLTFNDAIRFGVLTLARFHRADAVILTAAELEKMLADAGALALSRHIGRRIVGQPTE